MINSFNTATHSKISTFRISPTIGKRNLFQNDTKDTFQANINSGRRRMEVLKAPCYLYSHITAVSKAVKIHNNHGDDDQNIFKLGNPNRTISKYIYSLMVEAKAASDVHIIPIEAKDKQNKE